MGPILQERSTISRARHPESSSSKKGNRMKKAAGQVQCVLPGPGQEKDTQHRGAQSKGGRVKSVTTRNTSKLSSPEEEAEVRPPLRRHVSVQRKEERRDGQRPLPAAAELQPSRGGTGKSRRALSLPLSPISGLRHLPPHPLAHSPAPTPTPTPDALQQHYNHKDVDSDSASDLSDSERLPVLPSPCTPCTPPHLNLRAEVINSNDFPPDFPGPRGTLADEGDKPTYAYPDFLPPPFNSWSLRQLAVFLHTEGRGAPRPKPVGPLEKYLERLLQLEWLQIQTVQAESSRPPGSRPRPQSFPSAAAHPPRPHTAPPSRLNSPKGLRHSQRFPFAPLNTPPSPASSQHPPPRFPVCPHCHIRFPLCNGSCSAYAYQRHSRLSPLLERRARPGGGGAGAGGGAKRSSSETRAASSEGQSPGGGGGAQTPVSPSGGRSHLRQMQAAGNARKAPQEAAAASSVRAQARKSRVRANSETDVKKEAGGGRAAAPDKRAFAGGKRDGVSSRREREWPRSEGGAPASKPALKRSAKEPPAGARAALSTKHNGKTKTVHFVAK